MIEFNTFQNVEFKGVVGNAYPSNTVPNDALSMQEILERYTNGLSLPSSPVYYDDEEDIDADFPLDQIQDLDIAEAKAMYDNLNNRLEEQSKIDSSTRDDEIKTTTREEE